ncbi:M6 family metalloprotease domain-containing protein [Nocardioides sp. GY 10113]|uniref:immune inhibitor A domain-containing protein n=1 Tax=Nocardioides sp. GY 10113 TaxID=2569761 RepID=UPI0010A8E8B3|nr:immune inhibitor A domain-containing protein [Nocardioides sp. GY 10113]TIC88323.1 M6 family metalloprotease domain-containing protein [Nocardioides sp. GY 10113]
MRRLIVAVAGIGALAVQGTLGVGPANAEPEPLKPAAPPDAASARSDNLSSPLSDKQSAERTRAQEMVLSGEATPKGKNQVVKIAPGQYVELARADEDSIFSVLAEFGDQESPYGILKGGAEGPQHNQIPEPDRSVDNTTIWEPDFSQGYYEDLLFSEEPGAVSMRNYYDEMSSGAYSVNGDVTDWVQVPYRAAHYGRDWCGSITCGQTTWWFVRDSVNAWYQRALAEMGSVQAVDDYLAKFDVWDRYDYDSDGNFDEPDGYIDHFQSIHAGVGQETGGGTYGDDAIWSHRWYVQLTGIGSGGPTVGGQTVPFGGVQVGNSNLWIGDYTIEPENGGVGVFAHEFGHDLGLPDLYDTSGNTGGAENSTAFWTLMSSGSYGNTGKPEDGIGGEPTHMGNWEKQQLGWLDYDVVRYGEKRTLNLGPAEHRTKKSQGAFVLLPDKEVPLELGDPYEGDQYYYSGSGNDLDVSMTTSVTVGAGALTAHARYDIETDWDYAYLTVNGDPVATNLSTDADPNGQNFGSGITGSSGDTWVELTADLSAYAGQTVDLGFRYWTDGAVVGDGFQVDAITLDGTPIGTAETDEGWTFDGFRTTTGSEEQSFFNAYVLSSRQYLGSDDALRTGPYNFGFTSTMPDWVEHFSYQDGLLIDYWDTSYSDNNVGDHPGGGLLLPVDAHPDRLYWDDGTMMRPRIQSYDSTFGTERTDAYTLHLDGVPTRIPSQPAQRVFDDTKSWWSGGSAPGRYQPGWVGVDVPKTGTTVKVAGSDGHGVMRVHVNK